MISQGNLILLHTGDKLINIQQCTMKCRVCWCCLTSSVFSEWLQTPNKQVTFHPLSQPGRLVPCCTQRQRHSTALLVTASTYWEARFPLTLVYFYCRIWQGPFRVLITVIRAKVPKSLHGCQGKGPHLVNICCSKYGLAVKLLTTVLLMQCWKQAVITNCSRSHLSWSHVWAEKCKNCFISLSHSKPSSSSCRYEASCF